ncbi:MAG: T9SS type A sorting domain-containing protein, partial [Dysgonamonadaceae bacterium]
QLRWLNFWHGTIDNDWNKTGNWTSNFVPASGENIEFATEQNNSTISGVNYSGPAKNDLNLDKDRVIGDLINSSDKNLIITTGNQLTINGKVTDTNFNMGTIVVKASQDKPSGTLIFTNPGQNQNVGAIVEFYNQAYDCADCGFYTRSWQYFGIPVVSADFPYNDVTGTETINQWVEPFDGNKWQNAPYTPDTKLEAFKGYEITNNIKTQPTSNYRFSGIVKTSDAMVGLTKSTNVNYSGANLVGNSYTAAIPINADALIFPTGAELTVYLFNTGTRDQWRKLNGGSVSGVGYGQYLSVPINLGGTENLPSIIPSMHSFMVLTNNSGDLQIKYDKLVKNTTVNKGDGTQIVTRSTNNSENVESSIISNSKDQLPSIVIDVIGQQSADRVWIFTKGGTTNGFDNGWDGRKIIENGINQIYVVGDSKDDHFQVATVSALNNLQLDFAAGNSGTFTLEFSLSKHWDLEELYLHDLLTDKKHRVINGSSYRFEAKKDESPSRFRLLYSGNGIPTNDESAKITTDATTDGKIVINNNSNLDCTIFISNTNGKLVQKLEVKANSKESLENIAKETYVIRLQNALVSDVRKLVVK